MKTSLLRLLTAAPAVVGALCVLTGTAFAAESIESSFGGSQFASQEFASQEEEALLAQVELDTLDQISDYGALRNTAKQQSSFSQLTSVDQLRDVSPGSWAYEALRNLVENYGCIVGYPDLTYRGTQALTRWEFAAGLNACLTYMERLIQENVALLREDIDLLKRLAKEFEAELAALGARVDNLESRVSFLEDHQFSTTTKLKGEVLFYTGFAISEADGDGFAPAGSRGEDDDGGDRTDGFSDQAVFQYRARLNFDTSFTGNDRLRTRLEAGNSGGNNFRGDNLGFQFDGDPANDLRIDDLIYRSDKFFNDRVRFIIGLNGMDVDNDFTDTISPLDSSGSGALSEFADPAQYEQAFAGSGAGVGSQFTIFENDSSLLRLDMGYVADDAADPAAGEGLFNGPYQGLAQLTFLNDFIDVGVMYSNSYEDAADNFSRIGRTYGDGAVLANPAVGNTYGIQANVKVTDTIEIGGGFAYSDIRQLGSPDDFTVWSYQGTLAFRDLGREGNLLGILAGVPSYTRDLPGVSDDTSFLGEVFYRFYVNDNIHITPSVIVNTNPFNIDSNDATVIGSIRTTFKF